MDTYAKEDAADQNDGQSAQTYDYPFEFTGKGSEYFGIWIVNLLLTILTLGIYSAWAKVRRLQYFYRNTNLAGASLDYHGNPKAILKGRLIGFGLLALYNLSFQVNMVFGAVVAVILAAIFPWLIVRSLRFNLYNTSYRGLRFHFKGSTTEAYGLFLMSPIFVALSAYTLAPWWHRRLKAYQHGNAWYGDSQFEFTARTGQFYGLYLKTLGLIVLSGLAIGSLGYVLFDGVLGRGSGVSRAALTMLPLIIMVLFVAVIGPYFAARAQNLVWNHTSIGGHHFESRLSARRLLWIGFTNLLAIVVTLGLFKPFAQTRMYKYRMEALSLLAADDLDQFSGGDQESVSAVGEETAEMFDIDIGL